MKVSALLFVGTFFIIEVLMLVNSTGITTLEAFLIGLLATATLIFCG